MRDCLKFLCPLEQGGAGDGRVADLPWERERGLSSCFVIDLKTSRHAANVKKCKTLALMRDCLSITTFRVISVESMLCILRKSQSENLAVLLRMISSITFKPISKVHYISSQQRWCGPTHSARVGSEQTVLFISLSDKVWWCAGREKHFSNARFND